VTWVEQYSAGILVKKVRNTGGKYKVQITKKKNITPLNTLSVLNILFSSVPKYKFLKLRYKVEGFVCLPVNEFLLWLLKRQWSLSLAQ
jgi:hypothetical protein